jgi:hypothetical protein
MIGYLKPALAGPREQALFRAYQCSLCHTLGAEYGFAYRIFARPDLVFFNIFADLLSGSTGAEVTPRACVLSPLGSLGRKLPVRDQTDHTRFVAAFAVYIGIAKLRDDHDDDGGILRSIALRALRPGLERARRTLSEAGFSVEDVEEWMSRQAAVERGGSLALEDASRPTRQIARMLFSHPADEGAAPIAAAIGERVGSYLFYLDNLLDYHDDARSGSYNALSRAFNAGGGALPEPARLAAVSGARQQVSELTGLVAQLPENPHGQYVRKTLLNNLSNTLRRVETLDDDGLRAMTLRRLQTAHKKSQTWRKVAQAAVAFFVLWFSPRSLWAGQQLAAAIDSGDTGDTGGGSGGGGGGSTDTGWDDVDHSGSSSCGSCDGCTSCDACDGCDSCSSGCDGCDSCSSGCDAGCGGGGC